MALFMIRTVRITTKDEAKMKSSEIKKNDKVWVTFGSDEKLQGVVIDIHPTKDGYFASYLVMFKSINDVDSTGWYDAHRVFHV